MEICSCIGGFGITTYIIISLGIAEWFAFTVTRAETFGIDRTILWNFITASLSIIIWLNIPLMYALHTTGRQFKLLSVCQLMLGGPVLLVLSMVGSSWDAISYEGVCGETCDVFLQDLHWSFLFFVSLITFTLFLLYTYFNLCVRPEEESLERSLSPLNDVLLDVEEDTTCSICLQPLKHGEHIGIVKICKHQYHFACIENWLSINNKCPICRALV